MAKKKILAGLEIGSDKVGMVIGEAQGGALECIYAARTPCVDGIKNGTVVDLERVTEAIAKLLEEAAGKGIPQIHHGFVNISGCAVKAQVAGSVVTLPRRGCEIEKKHLDDLITSCKIVSVPMDEYLLYMTPLEYVLDAQGAIKDPVGLCGSRLEARILLVTAPFNQVQNIVKAANFAGLEIHEVVMTSLANASAILSREEHEQGVLIIDLKADLTELALIKNESLLFFQALPKGQRAVTARIASHFGLPFDLAEDLKLRYGFIDPAKQDPRLQEEIPLEVMGRRQRVTRGALNAIMEEELSSIIELAIAALRACPGFVDMARSPAVVLGGAASIEGLNEWAADRFGFGLRIGIGSQNKSLLEYDHAVSVGLLKRGIKREDIRREEPRFFKKIFQKTGDLLNDYF